MPINFDIKGDIATEKVGGFFCGACLMGKPLDDISPDPRYCQGCYEFLNQEATILPQGRRPKWVPRISPRTPPEGLIKGDIIKEKQRPIPNHTVLNMATVKGKKNEVAIIQPPPMPKSDKRGPKPKDLPVELITRWAGEGMGSKRIAAKLKADCGIKVGFRTVARRLSGQRVMV